jgi:hypothetical protein
VIVQIHMGPMGPGPQSDGRIRQIDGLTDGWTDGSDGQTDEAMWKAKRTHIRAVLSD